MCASTRINWTHSRLVSISPYFQFGPCRLVKTGQNDRMSKKLNKKQSRRNIIPKFCRFWMWKCPLANPSLLAPKWRTNKWANNEDATISHAWLDEDAATRHGAVQYARASCSLDYEYMGEMKTVNMGNTLENIAQPFTDVCIICLL